MKTFFLREWPCRSMYSTTSLCERSARIIALVAYTEGCACRFGRFHCRFRSTAARLQRELPSETPSMLSIGTILKWKVLRRMRACLDGPVR
jgi:hypothetical protein